MKFWSHYHVAHSVEEALELLQRYEGRAQVIAGGTDLLIDIQHGSHPPVETLIDITKIPELTTLDTVKEGNARYAILGAAVTHSTIVDDPMIRSQATCLTESCGVVGGPQIRNVATIGGNVAHALPAADGTLSLVALEAEAEVATPDRRERHPITALFTGPGQSIVDPTRDLLTRFWVHLSTFGEGSAFKRIMRPQGIALPILGCAVRVRLDSAREAFEDVSICLGPTGPVPSRAQEVERWLTGKAAEEAVIAEAAAVAKRVLHPRTSKYRATAEYRSEMIEVLVRRSLHTALIRARTGEAVPEGVE
ncbi:MAG TPA: FAD binding domain-containing protein [Aggregatilineales bacterium]|nr:FAD binding domain-containing protein [Aggregatilineales bacterium]